MSLRIRLGNQQHSDWEKSIGEGAVPGHGEIWMTPTGDIHGPRVRASPKFRVLIKRPGDGIRVCNADRRYLRSARLNVRKIGEYLGPIQHWTQPAGPHVWVLPRPIRGTVSHRAMNFSAHDMRMLNTTAAAIRVCVPRFEEVILSPLLSFFRSNSRVRAR